MNKNSYKWACKPFQELKPDELYSILQLRLEVFIIEQACIFQDMDDKDRESHHVMAWDGDRLVACTRILPKGLAYVDYPSIGRVVNRMEYRGQGAGRALMEYSIVTCIKLFGDVGIKIGAQLYLKRFYESLGFIATGDIYDEDGIDHIKMIRAATQK